ncbi:MAG: Rpn family recombination-promoting nuclease/putative transposase [Lachnospiraceae bacterium]|nr:Rpn family recombination-promoting nuclease/putative transposase [Lachnospiraceae bacterium]
MNNQYYQLFPDDASGEIDVTLTNDMMFHCVMQRSKEALKHLVCSLKGLSYEDIEDVFLLNPIDYSEFNLKEIILDTRILLRDQSILNIELQMYPQSYWKKRSLLYLCRSYDTLEEGDNYDRLKETVQVCITDQEFFPDQKKEFFSHFQFLNTQYHYPYSTLLSLYVLNLNHTDLATESDKKNCLVLWARMFMAKTWEEFHAIGEQFLTAKEVARVMYAVNINSQEKTYFEAHRKYLETKATDEYEMARLKQAVADKDQTISDMERRIAELESLVHKQDDQ